MGGMVTVFNPGRVPALLDSEGRTLGAGAWDDADPEDPQTAHALKQRIIIMVDRTAADRGRPETAVTDRPKEEAE